MEKEFKPCKMYHPSGLVKFARNEDVYNAYKRRGYSDSLELKQKEQSKPKKDAKKKDVKKNDKKD